MSSTIQIRVDDELKMKSDQLFKDLGTDTTTAIRMFLTQAVANNGFPFEIKRIVRSPYSPMTEEEILEIQRVSSKGKSQISGSGCFRTERKIWIIRLSLHQMQKKIWIDFFNIFPLKRKMNKQPEIFLTILEIH
jgi:DNA-damage-inducible protein J